MTNEFWLTCGPVPAAGPRATESVMGEPGSPFGRGRRIRWPASDDGGYVTPRKARREVEASARLQAEMVSAGLRCGVCHGVTAKGAPLEPDWRVFHRCDCPPLSACPTCWRWMHEGCKCATKALMRKFGVEPGTIVEFPVHLRERPKPAAPAVVSSTSTLGVPSRLGEEFAKAREGFAKAREGFAEAMREAGNKPCPMFDLLKKR